MNNKVKAAFVFVSLFMISESLVLKSKRDLNELNEGANNRCEEITVPMCRNMDYNHTSMPNFLNHETQQEAGLEAHQFYVLVELNCRVAFLHMFIIHANLFTQLSAANKSLQVGVHASANGLRKVHEKAWI